jgi:hypothetical protein
VGWMIERQPGQGTGGCAGSLGRALGAALAAWAGQKKNQSCPIPPCRACSWSLDDMMTALVALQEARQHGAVRRVLDLGCGIGSVLMMVAWYAR